MERKEAIRSAYRLTGGNNFYDGMITCSTLRESGMPLGVGYEQSGKRCLSGKGTVRHPGAFFRQAAGGAGGHRHSDHTIKPRGVLPGPSSMTELPFFSFIEKP